MDRKQIGNSGEDAAAVFLESKGFTILGRNVRNAIGEIDILAKDKATILIVEVKAGRTGQFGYAVERVGPNKQHKLRQLAGLLSQEYPNHPLRIDLVNVDPDSGEILHLVNAVEEAEH